MNFFDSLTSRACQINSLLCIGLDPRVVSASEAREACFRLIDSTAPYAAAFKPNAAFFELLGPEGWAALKDVIAYVPPDIPVILDAKRGDIANTAEAYARSAFDELGAHAITASPYLGRDSLAPFLNRSDRGVFLLCKTSNPGAGEIQSLQIGEVSRSASPVLLYEYIAQRAGQWNENNNLGLVVGATDLEALARVRNLAPDLWFLVPGIGAQGGDLQKALQAGLRNDGLGMLINVSRAVATAPDPAEAARNLRDNINECRKVTDYELQITNDAIRDTRYATRNTPPSPKTSSRPNASASANSNSNPAKPPPSTSTCAASSPIQPSSAASPKPTQKFYANWNLIASLESPTPLCRLRLQSHWRWIAH